MNKDDAYQRDETSAPLTAHQLRIAKSFNWCSFGAIVCAERGGKLLVVDGQNRLMAALRRSDVSQVPVVIIDTSGSNDQKRTEEARAFLELNGDRRLVSANQRFIAGCVAKDASSLAVKRASIASGVAICVGGKKVGTVACVDLLRKLIERRGEDSVIETLKVCLSLCDSAQISNRMVSAIDHLKNTVVEGRTLDDKFWGILSRYPQAAIEKAMIAGCVNTGMNGARILANGIITLVNTKCRNHYGMA